MKTALIVFTLVEVTLLVVVLALYLIAIARTLRKVAKTLGLVTFGVRAIEKQTEPIGPVLRDINAALEQVAGALELRPCTPLLAPQLDADRKQVENQARDVLGQPLEALDPADRQRFGADCAQLRYLPVGERSVAAHGGRVYCGANV